MPDATTSTPAAIGCRQSFVVSSREQASRSRRSSHGSKFVVQIGHEAIPAPGDPRGEQATSSAHTRNEARFTKVNSRT